MEGSPRSAGVGCKCFGLWLLSTAGILVYGETAPSIDAPDFTLALASLTMGVITYYTGCFFCLKAQRLGDPPPTRLPRRR